MIDADVGKTQGMVERKPDAASEAMNQALSACVQTCGRLMFHAAARYQRELPAAYAEMKRAFDAGEIELSMSVRLWPSPHVEFLTHAANGEQNPWFAIDARETQRHNGVLN